MITNRNPLQYQLYGEPVIRACIRAKCNYVDITGEPYFMEKMRQEYSELAREAGVLLVSSCGFDSIPNDLGALYVQRQFHGELAYLDSYITTSATRVYSGTWESFLLSIRSHWQLQALRRQAKEEKLPLPIYKMPRKGVLFFSGVMNKWAIPFPGADKAVMYRSQKHRYETEGANPFKVRTFFGMKSLLHTFAMAVVMMLILFLLSVPYGLCLLKKFPGLFSGGMVSKKGPSREDVEKATFTLTFEAFGYSPSSPDRSKAPDTRMVFRVRGAEPGYVATSAMLVQSALCMVYEKDALPDGGYLTPSVAFGHTDIIKNLEETGKVKIELVESA
jgi:short subunit dehydrogenase-like uncharacterized protein